MNSDMNEIADAVPAPEAQSKYTLKVLFGPMFGCELHLPADNYFLIINPGNALQDSRYAPASAGEHAAAYTQSTLYLPCDMPSPNLILYLAAPSEDEGLQGGYRVEVQDEVKSYPALLNENEVFTLDHIRFAVKRSEDEWPDSIKNFTLPAALDAEFNERETLEEFQAKKHHAAIIGSLILVVLLMVAAGIWYKKLENDRQVLSLNEALAGAPVPLDIVRGRADNLIYVLATKYQAMEWAREALFKLKEKNTTVPVWLTQQKKEVVEQLARAGYPVLQIDYTKPQHPVIALWQNLSAQQQLNLKSAALQKIPFALDIKTVVKPKAQLLQDARQGLDRLHIPYRQINTSTGYALVVRDALNDNTLRALQHFMTDFNHQWGNRIINFSINLDENWLENKSYLDSSNGYLFLNPRHWYFPLKHGDINV
jgi:type III secretion system PrgH/EprH family protein